jgi:hypothetical protein
VFRDYVPTGLGRIRGEYATCQHERYSAFVAAQEPAHANNANDFFEALEPFVS